jgi:hypothetical protein
VSRITHWFGVPHRRIETPGSYTCIFERPDDKRDARVTINGETICAMTACSYFGESKPPRGFAVVLLGADRPGNERSPAEDVRCRERSGNPAADGQRPGVSRGLPPLWPRR